MLPLVTFPELEALTCAHLHAVLAWPDPVTVGRDVPTVMPSLLVTVVRDGGRQVDSVTEQARLRVNVWADLPEVADALARRVSAVLRAWPDGQPVWQVLQVAGPLSIPEESGKRRRYLLFDVLVRGT
jgi:alkylated DNA nucleotide flippase Atl1